MCRSFLSVWKDENGKEVLDGRQNLGVDSLNLPMIGCESKRDFKEFWKLLDYYSEVCHIALKSRIKIFENVTSDIAPILYQNGAFGVRLGEGEKISKIFKDGRSSLSLGFIGCHELACYMFNTDTVFGNEDAYQFTLDVVQFLRDKCDKWKNNEKQGYSLYSTPSEGYCSRALEKCKIKYGIIPNVTDKDFFTNSFHLDVNKKVTPFEKIDFEAPFQAITSGGNIGYAEFPVMLDNLEALEVVWDYAMEKMNYFGSNTPIDNCTSCGFRGEIPSTVDGSYKCPNCGEEESTKLDVCRRLCGYLGQITQRPVNKGKQQEFTMRVKHS